jgi:predicted ATPase/class 3 adenylate cyclase
MAERAFPTGTVTFLFSDMEGSTRLVQDLGPAVFTEVLERHNAILRAAFGRHGATERGTQGDSFLVLFPEAPAAVAAAADAQRALDAAEWPAAAGIRVRMGLHTGIARLGGDDYVGLDVNRAARICGLGHGGQVLLSDATRALTANDLPAGVSLRSLGPHRLRDLDRPEPLHQLVIESLRSDFPPLAAADSPGGNLPKRLTSFVGRDRELEMLEHLLAGSALVTLTGPGGAGKTRLAIETARRRASSFGDGAWLVRLEGIEDPELVLDAIAGTLGLVESPQITPIERLQAFLAGRSILLVLDNFEHLMPAAAGIHALLERAGPDVRMVVTSRAPLRIGPEQEFPLGQLDPSDAIGLFVERARRADPSFGLTDENRGAVAEICEHLDGLPLGIELAASRIGLLPAPAIADQLTRRLDLPGVAPRDLPARQRTLTDAIAWSYSLLDEPARRLLDRLSVFAGGFRLAELEAVAGTASELGAEPIDALAVLVEQSLVESIPGPDLPRYRLLETIQRFGAGRLAEADATAQARDRHARAYLALAEEAARNLPSRHQVPWLDRMTVDHDNLRAAFGWALERDDAELAHRLLAASWRFWQFRGHVTEGTVRASEVLAMPGGDVPTTWRMRALEAAGGLAWWGADVPRAHAHYEGQLAAARRLGDQLGIADALFNLIHTQFLVHPEDPVALEAMRTEADAIYRDLKEHLRLARLTWTSAYPLAFAGHSDEARAVILETLEEFERSEDDFYIALVSAAMGGIALMERDVPTAVRLGLRSLQANQAMGDVASITLTLRAAAALWAIGGRPEEAATLLGAFEGHCRRYGVRPPMNPDVFLALGGPLDELLTTLAQPELAAARAHGESMSTDAVLDYMFEHAAELTSEPARP